jgi:hypothetical protein
MNYASINLAFKIFWGKFQAAWRAETTRAIRTSMAVWGELVRPGLFVYPTGVGIGNAPALDEGHTRLVPSPVKAGVHPSAAQDIPRAYVGGVVNEPVGIQEHRDRPTLVSAFKELDVMKGQPVTAG